MTEVIKRNLTRVHCDLCLSTINEGRTEKKINSKDYIFCCPACAQVFSILGPEEAQRQGPTFKNLRDSTTIPEGPYNELWIKVGGMVCGSCASLIEGLIHSNPGVVRAVVEPVTEIAHILYAPALSSKDKILGLLKKYGFPSQEFDQSHDESTSVNDAVRLVLSIVLGANAMMNAMVMYAAFVFDRGQNYLSNLIFMEKIYDPNPIPESVRGVFTIVSGLTALPLLAYCGWPILVNGFRRLRLGEPNTDTLVGFGALVAFFVSLYSFLVLRSHHVYFDTASMLVSLLIIGRAVEKSSKRKAQRFIQGLLAASPSHTLVWRSGQWEKIEVNQVMKEERIRVIAGELVPLDGLILEGHGWIETTTLTGEPKPQSVKLGEQILAGYLCREGYVEIQTSCVASETIFSGILNRVKHTLAFKPAIQLLADRLASIFFPILVVLSVVTGLSIYFSGQALVPSLMAAVSVLVVACPCALGLATPMVLIQSVAESAKRGFLLRGSEMLEVGSKIKHVVFDKTGTLTQGKLSIVREEIVSESEETIYGVVGALEQFSSHPLAQSLFVRSVQSQHQHGFEFPEVSSFVATPGLGIEAVIADRNAVLGNMRWLTSRFGVSPFSNIEDAQGSQVGLVLDQRWVGYWEFQDVIREEAKISIRRLRAMGITPWMISGDHEASCRFVAQQVGIASHCIVSQALPQEKASKIESIQQDGFVAMVGDGINDAVAISQANLGIAMSNGSGVSLESAGVVLVNQNLKQIALFLQLARQAYRRIRQNLVWAFVYNIALIPIAVFGWVHPILAAAAMMISSISVILNSARRFDLGRPSINLEGEPQETFVQ